MITCNLHTTTTNGTAMPAKIELYDDNCTRLVANLTVTPTNFSNRTKQVGVCAKVIYGSPDPVRLVEWIELNRILGAHAIYLYNTSVSNGLTNEVLLHYQKEKFVKLVQHDFLDKMARIIYKSKFPTFHYAQNWVLEVLSMNDCLYTASEAVLVNIDIDELLTPAKRNETLKDLSDLYVRRHPDAAGFRCKTGIFSDEIPVDPNQYPEYMHMIKHNRRTQIDTESPKSIIHTGKCTSIGHHVCRSSVEGYRTLVDVNASEGYLRHYRHECRLTGEKRKCERLLKSPSLDKRLSQYAQKLNGAMIRVFEKLNLTYFKE